MKKYSQERENAIRGIMAQGYSRDAAETMHMKQMFEGFDKELQESIKMTIEPMLDKRIQAQPRKQGKVSIGSYVRR